METRMMEADRSRIGTARAYDLAAIGLGLAGILIWWQVPIMPWRWVSFLLGVLVLLWGVYQLYCTSLVFSQVLELTESCLTIRSRAIDKGIVWQTVTGITVRERKAGIEQGRSDRLILIYQQDGSLPTTINSNVFTIYDEQVLLSYLRRQAETRDIPIEVKEDW